MTDNTNEIPKQEKITLVEKIKSRMEYFGYNITDLHNMTGVPAGTLSRLINGKKGEPVVNTSIENLHAILIKLRMLDNVEINEQIHAGILAAVETWIDDNNHKIDPLTKSRLIIRLYDRYLAKGFIDDDDVKFTLSVIGIIID